MNLLSVTELQQALAAGGLTLIDVRTEEELALAALPGALHLPMHELPARLADLNPQARIAVLCHHGVRSEMAARFLERNGFSDVSSVTGGIDAWSLEIDPTVPRY
ncbi:MAG TPA: rhodanese-like domain-containing protein [Solimonas sp.]|nr:rhodanese-like domain-containing protein [Solimonas sp.]